MSQICFIVATLLLAVAHASCFAYAPADTSRPPRSGGYDAIEVAYDPETKLVTGYYSEDVGWNEQAQAAQYSCNFYLFGYWDGVKAQIHTFFPSDTADDIKGTLTVASNGSVILCLESDHGGCSGHTSCDDPPFYSISQPENWMQLRYIDVERSSFYDAPAGKKLKSYVTRGDMLYIYHVNGNWARARYVRKKVTEGWIKLEDLNNVKW